MSYVDQNLMNGENVMYRAKLHWIVFLWPVIWVVVAFLSADCNPLAAAMFVLIGIATGIASVINYWTSEFALTNKRVMMKVGFIRRSTIELLLSKVEGIQVRQSILGRILGFGSITISGTGGTQDPFHKIDAPLEFRKKAQEQIALVQEQR